MAFFTQKIKFPDLQLVPFMPYTYNIQGWHDGTRDQQTMLKGSNLNFQLMSNLIVVRIFRVFKSTEN